MRRIICWAVAVGLLAGGPSARASGANDDRSDAQPMNVGGWFVPDDWNEGTVEPGEDVSCLAAVDPGLPTTSKATFWYRFQVDTDATIEITGEEARLAAPQGLGAFETGSEHPLSCGSYDGSFTVLRWRAEAGKAYDVQVSCECDDTQRIASGGLSTAAIVPVNDDLSAATAVTTLPFADEVYLASATVDHHSPDCDLPGVEIDQQFFDTTPPLVYTSTRNAWYRYVAPEDLVLLIEGFRYVSAPHLNVYFESADGLTLLQCRTPETRSGEYEPYQEFVRARVEVKAGEVYLFELIEGDEGIPHPAELNIRNAA